MADPAESSTHTVTTTAPSHLDEAIEKWYREFFCREPIAQNTEHLNHCRRAVDELKKRLASA